MKITRRNLFKNMFLGGAAGLFINGAKLHAGVWDEAVPVAGAGEEYELEALSMRKNIGPPSCTVLSYNIGESVHKYIMNRLKEGVAPATVIRKEAKYAGQAFFGHSSGMFIDERGYILTNDHCISPYVNDRRVVIMWKAKYNGFLHVMDTEVVALGRNVSFRRTGPGISEITDLALLKINNAGMSFPAVKFPKGKIHAPEKWAYSIFNEGIAITAPFGLNFTVSGFRISAVRYAKEINESYPYDTTKFDSTLTILQLEGATIGPGSSGGPIYDKRAELIGIISSTIEVPGSDIIFAISVDNIKNWVRAIEPSILN